MMNRTHRSSSPSRRIAGQHLAATGTAEVKQGGVGKVERLERTVFQLHLFLSHNCVFLV